MRIGSESRGGTDPRRTCSALRPCAYQTPPRPGASIPSREPSAPGPRLPSSQPTFNQRGAWQRIPRTLILLARRLGHIRTSDKRTYRHTHGSKTEIHARHSPVDTAHTHPRGHTHPTDTHLRACMNTNADKLGSAPNCPPGVCPCRPRVPHLGKSLCLKGSAPSSGTPRYGLQQLLTPQLVPCARSP